MSQNWPMVPLGVVAVPAQRPVAVVPGQSYRTLGVKWWGEGAYERDTIDGSATAAATLYEVQEDDLIINKILVRHGSVAIAGPQLHGCAGSNEFPTFVLDRAKALPRWIHWYTKTRDLWQKCDALSQGTSGKNRIRPERFLTITIPLPPLTEQRRIVAKVEELAAKIEEARGLKRLAGIEAKALWDSGLTTVFDVLSRTHTLTSFGSVCEVVRGGSPRPAGSPIYYDGSIPFLKVGDITKDSSKFISTYTATIKEAGLSRSRRVEPNTLMLTNSGATLGVPKICTIRTCFNDGIQAFLNLPDDLCKEYLYYFLLSRTRWFREQAARGQGQPNLNTGMVKCLRFPRPSLSEQRRIVAYLDALQAKVDALKALQAHTAADLAALLPSVLDKAFKGEL